MTPRTVRRWGIAAAIICFAGWPSRAAGPPIRVALITTPHASILAGARVGAEEAKHTAAMFERNFHLEIIEVTTAKEAAAAARRAVNVAAIVGGTTPEIADAIAVTAKVPFLEILTRASPRAPSDRRYRLSAAGADRSMVAWHHDLRRYGAGELNERFVRRTGRSMDPASWSAWLAMKIVVEAALRGRDIGAIRIDGHKGTPLTFDTQRVLRQPLYKVDAKGKLVD